MNKFEQLLDYIVNEEKEKAEELFHEIVVEKSRDIYESLIAEETEEDQVEEASEEDEEATEESTEESVEEAFGMDDEAGDEFGGDATDDLAGDVAADDGAEDEFGGEEGGEEGGEGTPATKADVQDLEDALDELKAEFERLMSGVDQDGDGDHDMADHEAEDEAGADEEGGEEDEAGAEDEEGKNPFESRQMTREYRETVGKPYGSGNGISNKNEQGDGKAGPVSSGKGKPTSGATAKNIAQGNTGGEGIKGGEGLVGGVKGEFTKGVEKNIASSSKAGMKSGSALDGKGKAYGAGGASTSETGAGNTKSVVDHKIG